MITMTKTAVKVNNLGKMYRIGKERPEPNSTLGRIGYTLRSPFEWLITQMSKPDEEETLWAFRNVSFSINEGEVVGLIGANGAGKSTLLKVLSRITEPTEGQAVLNGRISSLLEIGTGMSPELTGRENIYVNGCVLGMKKKEIEARFDEIVEFAGIKKFVDTQVKRYSSGMKVRLGFAIAAHLEPEILIVDEVLAVGDAEFREKCLNKMHNIASHGRTVLFVSHNMQAIEQLCERAILFEEGRMVMDSQEPRQAVDAYLTRGKNDSQSTAVWEKSNDQFTNQWFTPRKLTICQSNGKPAETPFRYNDEIFVRIEGDVEQIDPATRIGFRLTDERETTIFISDYSDGAKDHSPQLKRGHNILQAQLPKGLLNEGKYKIHLNVKHPTSKSGEEAIIVDSKYGNIFVTFTIASGLSHSPYWHYKRPGIITPILPWKQT